jgi:hypothetical protein
MLAAALVLLVVAPSAMAFVTRAKTASFGSDGTSGTSFGDPSQLAFNQTNDKLYVLDKAGPKIHAFNTPALTLPGGAFPLTVATPGGEPDIAVDNTALGSANNIYYVTENQQKIYGFNSAGTALGGNFPINPAGPKDLCGSAVDSAGNLWVGDFSAKQIRKYDSAGNSLGSVSTSAQGPPCHVAFDSNDDMFVAKYTGPVWKYTAPTYTTATKIDSGSSRGIAVDRTAHRLYVVHSNSASAYNSTTGAFLYDFAVGIPSESLAGVAVDEGTDQVYVSDTGTGNDKVYIFGAAQNFADADATPSAAKNITDTSAEIGATITDNNVLPTSWRLELSADGGANWSTVESGHTTGSQTGAALSGTATGLQPNSTYRFRVVTNKGTSAATEVTSYALFFTTVAPPPVLTDVGAVQVADTSARLVGTIDPRHSATGYVFEYGTTPALGSATAPLNIGSGTKPITVSQVIGGLNKDTDYYFRVVATNLTGTTNSVSKAFHTRAVPPPAANQGNCANEAVRAEQGSSLPECRAYEMASPPDKNQGGVDQFFVGEYEMALARDGEAATYCTNALFGEPAGQSAAQCAPYVSRRTPTGWQTSDPFPRHCTPTDQNGFGGALSVVLNTNFDRALDLVPESSYCPIPFIDPSAADQSLNLYRQDLSTDPFGFDLVTPTPPTESELLLVGGSDDFSHVVFKSFVNQTPDSPAPGNFPKLYDWEQEGHGGCVTPGGCMRLVTKKPNGEPFTTRSTIPIDHSITPGRPIGSMISANGSRIFFYNGEGAFRTLYMREDGTTTYDLSAPECVVPADCGANSSEEKFVWADEAGDVALFRSCDKLTDASKPCTEGDKLYRWDRNAAPGHRLTDLSVAVEAADGTAPQALGIVGASDDGSVVYLINGGSGTEQLYRIAWNGGSPTAEHLGSYVAYQLAGFGNLPDFEDVGNGTLDQDPNVEEHLDRVSADGKYMTLTTPLRLDPAADHDEDLDAYRWGEGEGWTCVSCQLPGAASAGSVNTIVPECCERTTINVLNVFDEQGHLISEDGQRIFFTARDALVPEDVNGEVSCPRARVTNHTGQAYACQDVYEWHDGTLSLISSGTGSNSSTLLGADASGQDVAIITRDRLVGWDTDNGTDIYDARIGGGFPEPQPAPLQCDLNAGACEGPATVAPSTTGAGSAVFEGPGNPKPSHKKAPRKHRSHHHKQQKRHGKRAHSRAANHNRRAHR